MPFTLVAPFCRVMAQPVLPLHHKHVPLQAKLFLQEFLQQIKTQFIK